MPEFFTKHLALIFPALICASILVIVAPLPPAFLDILISANITLSVLILLSTIYVKNPLELSVFPTILLATTLARLVLNVASTRLILTGAADRGTEAAGGVIAAFGEFVAGGSATVGFILFGVLIAIQWLVVTKGATRISEVAARFALDGMPGKQMAIDADLNAGLIDGEQAKKRRTDVTEQADFYGAMDGASKFVRGDAIAGLVITAINVIGGLYLGVFENGMSFTEAGSVFTTLTIGDGLVTQVPTFLVSIASGLIVTRTSADSNLQTDIIGQLFRHPTAMYMAASFLMAMAFTGLPMTPLLTLSAGCAFIGYTLSQSATKRTNDEAEVAEQETHKPVEVKPEDRLEVDALELELGVGLLRIADPNHGGDLLDRVTNVRLRIADELGMILPKVRIRDNVTLPAAEYQISLRGVPVAWGNLKIDGRLAIDTGAVVQEVPGLDTVDPAYGRPARWIESVDVGRAEMNGYSVVEPSAVVVTHLTEVVREHAGELLTRQQVHALVDLLKSSAEDLIGEVIPDVIKVSHLHQVLTLLLRERVPIRDLEAIVETLGDYGERTKEPTILTEYVRHSLARTLCKQYRDRQRVIHVATIDPVVEDTLSAGMEFAETGLIVKLAPQTQDAFNNALGQQLEQLTSLGYPPVLLCSPQIRAGVHQITSNRWAKLAVLSLNEITRDTEVEAHGQVDLAGMQSHLGGVAASA